MNNCRKMSRILSFQDCVTCCRPNVNFFFIYANILTNFRPHKQFLCAASTTYISDFDGLHSFPFLNNSFLFKHFQSRNIRVHQTSKHGTFKAHKQSVTRTAVIRIIHCLKSQQILIQTIIFSNYVKYLKYFNN